MESPICVTCGVQHSTRELGCRICEDERQYVGWNGQEWTSSAQMTADGYVNRVVEVEPNLWGIGTEPRFAIGQRALLVQTPTGNVLWDCISLLDEATIAEVRNLGGIAAISASHPHFYGSLVEWSRAFDGAPILLPTADRQWVCRDDDAYEYYDESVSPQPGVTIIRCGGHFDGSAVLHWEAGADGRGALLTGDTIQVVLDRNFVSFMRSYPNLIPMGADAISAILERVAPYEYDRVHGGWWDRTIPENAPALVAASASRYLRWSLG